MPWTTAPRGRPPLLTMNRNCHSLCLCVLIMVMENMLKDFLLGDHLLLVGNQVIDGAIDQLKLLHDLNSHLTIAVGAIQRDQLAPDPSTENHFIE